MKVTSVRYAMLRVTGKFENDRAEVEVELGPKDTVEAAYKYAVAQCQLGLQTGQRVDLGRRFDQLAEILCDDEGAAQFKLWVAKQHDRILRQSRGEL